MRAKYEATMIVQQAPLGADEHHVVLRHLARPALSARLDYALRYRGHAPHVVAGELATAGVHRQGAVGTGATDLDEWPALALLTEAVVLQRHQRRVRVAVVQLADVHILVRDTRHAEGRLLGEHGARVDLVLVAGTA